MRPVIGITTDIGTTLRGTRRYESACAYARAVTRAGGLPVLLPQEVESIAEMLRWCHGIVFTGGDDPRMELFDPRLATHACATVLDEGRQRFEMELLSAVRATMPDLPVLGICWGMQLLALQAGGALHQHLPEAVTEAEAAAHAGNRLHAVRCTVADGLWGELGRMSAGVEVVSSHHQAVAAAGSLRVTAVGPGEVVEAIDDPRKRFYVGVQWHPERGGEESLNLGLFARLVAAARVRR